MLATCGVLIIAMLAITACAVFNVDSQVCLGTVGLVIGGVYFVNVENRPNLFSGQYKSFLPFLVYLVVCTSCIIGAENFKTLIKMWREFL